MGLQEFLRPLREAFLSSLELMNNGFQAGLCKHQQTILSESSFQFLLPHKMPSCDFGLISCLLNTLFFAQHVLHFMANRKAV